MTPGESAFDALLARLAAEGGASPAHAYERLRTRLIAYFQLHRPAQADWLADQALDRLAQRIRDGTSVQSVHLYALGIARMLVHESSAHARRELEAGREASLLERPGGREPDDHESDAEEAVLTALEGCLERLGKPEADFILAYYASGQGARRIEARRRLAGEHGISPNALRNRALRLREALERCARERLGWRDESPHPDTSDD